MFLYKIFFPKVQDKDKSKFLSTALMFVCISTVYAILRRVKDIIIVNTLKIEYINLIKLLFVMPATIAVIAGYQIVLHKLSREKRDSVINYTTTIFGLYFSAYTFILLFFGYDGFKAVSFNLNCDGLTGPLSVLLIQLSHIINNIWHVFFYLFSELYGTMVLSFGFWAYVNRYTSVESAKQYYPYIIALASFSSIFSGGFGIVLDYFVPGNHVRYHEIYNGLNLCIVVCLIGLSMIFYRNSLYYHRLDPVGDDQIKKKKKKLNPGLWNLAKDMFSNKLVLAMLLCVVSYMASINLVEVTWKKCVVKHYLHNLGDKAGYNKFLGLTQSLVGVLSIAFSYLVQIIYYRFGWTAVGLLNPIMLGITGILFFVSFLVSAGSSIVLPLILSPHFIGAIQGVCSKSLKYSAFDFSKETFFLSLDSDTRERGKAVVDVIGGRVGKSLGGLIQIALMTIFVTKDSLHIGQEIIAPYITIILACFVAVWLLSVIYIGKSLLKASSDALEIKYKDFSSSVSVQYLFTLDKNSISNDHTVSKSTLLIQSFVNAYKYKK